jgi:hypothetical protein
MTNDDTLCAYCKTGYHAPFERFERVATHADGPTFLNRCTICGSLWHETLHSAARVSIDEAIALYGPLPRIETHGPR